LHQGQFVGINREAVLEWIPADSVFAALVSVWARAGINVAERLQPNATGQPPFMVSSAMPRAGTVRFYPAPPRLPAHSGLITADGANKAVKKLRWMSQQVYEALRDGRTPDFDPKTCLLHGQTVWVTSAERQTLEKIWDVDDDGHPCLWKEQIVPHVVIDRTNNAPNLFHTGRVTFAREAGLWFAMRGPTAWVEEALAVLTDAGLGGLRSTGHGAFTWQTDTVDLPMPTAGWGLCLSRYAPANPDELAQALQAPESAYRMVTVGGWCEDEAGQHWRRRAVRLLAEGALLPAGVRGQLIDVRPLNLEAWRGPQRPVYRSGWPFLVPAGKLAEAA
jgi:CRISPR type III-A-associated RAMP protein Csm4